MNLFKKLLGLILIGLFMFSCEKDENFITVADEQININGESSALAVEDIDLTFFDHIKGLGDTYDQKEFYDGYDFKNISSYIIHKTNGQPDRAYVINPKTDIQGAVQLSQQDSKGLNIYRYDAKMQDGINELDSGNGYFAFDYVIDGQEYYIQKYEDGDVANFNAIDFMTHEIFHSEIQFDIWDFRFNWIQDVDNYPITKEILELEIMLAEMFKEYPNEENDEVIWAKLIQYVAIKTKEIEIDSSSRELIKNMALEQERIEGGAEYVESMGARAFFESRRNKTFIFYPGYAPLARNFNNFSEVRDYFAGGIFYDTGASVLYSIYKSCKENLSKITSDTPYGIASSSIPLTPEQVTEEIEKAKASVDWAAIQNKAEQLMALQNKVKDQVKGPINFMEHVERLIHLEKRNRWFFAKN